MQDTLLMLGYIGFARDCFCRTLGTTFPELAVTDIASEVCSNEQSGHLLVMILLLCVCKDQIGCSQIFRKDSDKSCHECHE